MGPPIVSLPATPPKPFSLLAYLFVKFYEKCSLASKSFFLSLDYPTSVGTGHFAYFFIPCSSNMVLDFKCNYTCVQLIEIEQKATKFLIQLQGILKLFCPYHMEGKTNFEKGRELSLLSSCRCNT